MSRAKRELKAQEHTAELCRAEQDIPGTVLYTRLTRYTFYMVQYLVALLVKCDHTHTRHTAYSSTTCNPTCLSEIHTKLWGLTFDFSLVCWSLQAKMDYETNQFCVVPVNSFLTFRSVQYPAQPRLSQVRLRSPARPRYWYTGTCK